MEQQGLLRLRCLEIQERIPILHQQETKAFLLELSMRPSKLQRMKAGTPKVPRLQIASFSIIVAN
jgi:hypothetical protein